MLKNNKSITLIAILILIIVCSGYYVSSSLSPTLKHFTNKDTSHLESTTTEEESSIKKTQSNDKTLKNNTVKATTETPSTNGDNYIVRCDNKYATMSDDDKKKLSLNHQQYIELVSQSNKPNEALAYYLHSDITAHPAPSEFLVNFIQKNPFNTIAFDYLLLQCVNNIELRYCNDELFKQANVIDKDNGAFWYSIASIKAKRNDTKGFLEAMQTANQRQYFNDYYFEVIELIEQSYAQASSIAFTDRLVSGIGVAAAKQSTLNSIIEYCKKLSHESLLVSDSCHQLGLNLEKHSKTFFSQLMGLALQKLYREYQKDEQGLKRINKKIEQHYLEQSKGLPSASSLMMHDEKLARDWLDTAIARGEKAATAQLVNDALLYSKNSDYNPCPANN